MTVSNLLILLLLFLVFTALSGLFSGAETGMYQLSRLRLRLGIEKRYTSYVVLGRVMRDTPALLLSMLVGTNLANCFATSIVTFLLLARVGSEQTAELMVTVITSPILFIFSELIPKNIFFYRADLLMPYVAWPLLLFHKLFTYCGAVGLLKYVSGFFARLGGTPATTRRTSSAVRHPHIEAIIRHTREEGILSPTQTDILSRLTVISSISIGSVMTPLSNIQKVPIEAKRQDLLKILEKSRFTRLPVYRGSESNIVGFINIFEVLCSKYQFGHLQGYIQPIRRLSADTTVAEAISVMQRERQKIVLVQRAGRFGDPRPLGIVTMKDLVEELLGELAEW